MLSPKFIFLLFIFVLFAGCFQQLHDAKRNEKNNKPDYSYRVDCSNLDTMTLSGNFQGQNIYVQNPFVMCLDSSLVLCTQTVLINGVEDRTDILNSSAYEIDLIHLNFKPHDPIEIKIIYISGSLPHVLNPEVR